MSEVNSTYPDETDQAEGPLSGDAVKEGAPAWYQALPEEDRNMFSRYTDELLNHVYGLVKEHKAQAQRIVDIMIQVHTELSTLSSAYLAATDHVLIGQIPLAILDTSERSGSGFAPPAREAQGICVLMLDERSSQVQPVDVRSWQRSLMASKQRMVWDFAERHPDLPQCAQVLVDWVSAVQMSDQSDDSAYKEYRRLKKTFYEQYANMVHDTATTDTAVELQRLLTIFQHSREGVGDGAVLFAGSGDMQRLEGPLLQSLRAAGIPILPCVAIDRIDYHDQIKASQHTQGVEFRCGDIDDPALTHEAEFRLIVLPWSMLSDILPEKDLRQSISFLASRLSAEGSMVVDQPLAYGEKGYAAAVSDQAEVHGTEGMMTRPFEGPDGETLWSTFNIISLSRLTQIAAECGLELANIPGNIPEQSRRLDAYVAQADALDASPQTEAADPFTHPFYDTKNGNRRMTLVFTKTSPAEAKKAIGCTGISLLAPLPDPVDAPVS